MQLNLIENGLDSLQKGYIAINEYEKLLIQNGNRLDKSLLLKSAILQIHHGIEILMKYILLTHSEYLIFSNIDTHVKDAYKEKQQKCLSSVFEASNIDKVHTVTYSEAFERLCSICGDDFSKKFKDKINTLNLYRNRLTHSEISIEDGEIILLLNELIDELDIYFFEKIGQNYKTMSGYGNLIQNYEEYKKWLIEKNMITKANAIKKLAEIFQKLHINMGTNEVKRIEDITISYKIFEELYKDGFKFGTDLYNGTCSGNVTKIKRISKDHLSLFAADNNGEEIFKFKSMIIFIPEFSSNFSPIFIFESDDDNDLSEIEIENKREVYCKKDKYVIEGLKISTEEDIIYDNKRLNELYYLIDNEPIDFSYYHVTKHLSKCIFCMINIQGLNYGRFGSIASKYYNLDANNLTIRLRQGLNK